MTLDIVMFGLSITSSWGNGHATTYRALIKALAARGHRITFLERDVPWYRDHRDLKSAAYCQIELYSELREIPRRYGRLVMDADLVVLGSYVPDGAVLADWITTNAHGVTAFYDIDTPETLARIESDDADYITAAMIPRFDLYLSFTGGPTLDLIEERYGNPRPRPLYCAVDADVHTPIEAAPHWMLGYLGTYSADRQPALDRLLREPARRMRKARFAVAGAQYPGKIRWSANVDRVEHLPPSDHAAFFAAQRYTLNITRANMVARGYSPSVRLFEAAACGVPVISDPWPGLETILTPDKEILVARDAGDVIHILTELSEDRRRAIAAAARKRILRSHTADHRARQLEDYYQEVVAETAPKEKVAAVAAASPRAVRTNER
jgi:spore maturation protein CgeB